MGNLRPFLEMHFQYIYNISSFFITVFAKDSFNNILI